ncbi:MAG TPA: Rossmann-like and DUF2520 domain-containing protein [Pyrinomonadaceae bacterium]|jgi:predicted short-subunit dehydrogenase-like oxidoreductase (DUF2520 family)|nr:Rossmann-like and DUF2520 domain-containing protein [Pyrinomonadaceae bacterium]
MPNHKSIRKPTVNIIGPGRLGTALAIALTRRKYRVETLVGRRLSKLKRAAALLDADVQLVVSKEIKQFHPSDLTIIATPDDQIVSVADSLSTFPLDRRSSPTVLHTSGALSSVVLTQLKNRGWRTGSIHPLVSVSDPAIGAKAFDGAFWCVEGDRKAKQVGRELVRDLGGRSFSISRDAKALYHAAALMSSGGVVALFDVAIDMLDKCGLKRAEARLVLLPLLESTLENLKTRPPAKAITGTFTRGDIATVDRHLAALSTQGLADARALYRLLGHKALELAEENGLDRRVAMRIVNKLEE